MALNNFKSNHSSIVQWFNNFYTCSGLGGKHHYKDHCSVKCRVRWQCLGTTAERGKVWVGAEPSDVTVLKGLSDVSQTAQSSHLHGQFYVSRRSVRPTFITWLTPLIIIISHACDLSWRALIVPLTIKRLTFRCQIWAFCGIFWASVKRER